MVWLYQLQNLCHARNLNMVLVFSFSFHLPLVRCQVWHMWHLYVDSLTSFSLIVNRLIVSSALVLFSYRVFVQILRSLLIILTASSLRNTKPLPSTFHYSHPQQLVTMALCICDRHTTIHHHCLKLFCAYSFYSSLSQYHPRQSCSFVSRRISFPGLIFVTTCWWVEHIQYPQSLCMVPSLRINTINWYVDAQNTSSNNISIDSLIISSSIS